MFRAAIITASDKGYAGEREDLSGSLIRDALIDANYLVLFYGVFPDEKAQLSEIMRELCDRNEVDLVLTTGGTGLGPRDCTPEATLDIAHRRVPGIAEAMRIHGMKSTPKAMLSRGVAVLRKYTLIINLPGSPRAVAECLGHILPTLEHGLEIMKGEAAECARTNGPESVAELAEATSG